MTRPRPEWKRIPETGTFLALRFTLLSVRLLGRRVTRGFVYVVIFYYALFARRARRASRDYLRRSNLPHGFWAVYRHLFCFGSTVLDRLYFVQDDFRPFDISRTGHHYMEELAETRRGAILLGAHLGSFEVMRTQSMKHRFPINVVGDFSNAERINAFLRRLNPDIDTRLISISEGAVGLALKIQRAIDAGELVAILGDRAGEGASLPSRFLGSPVRFPTGPYMLAAMLRCPVYLTFGLHRSPNRYELYCEPFAEKIVLPRGSRREALQQYVDQYASRLEHYCRLAPNNWFNFFPYWDDQPAGAVEAPQPTTQDVALVGKEEGCA